MGPELTKLPQRAEMLGRPMKSARIGTQGRQKQATWVIVKPRVNMNQQFFIHMYIVGFVLKVSATSPDLIPNGGTRKMVPKWVDKVGRLEVLRVVNMTNA